MSWQDNRPTEPQLSAIYSWAKWKLDTPLLQESLKWLGENATRGGVSKEMQRIRALYYDHKLDTATYFNSPIWDGFKAKGEE